MTTSQNNKLEMYQAVQAALQASSPVGTPLPALVVKIDELANKVAAIVAEASTQAQPVQGLLEEREDALTQASETAIAIAGLALSYAHARGLPDFAANVRLTSSRFKGLRRSRRMGLAQQALDAIRPHLAPLADYGVTEAMLTDLQTKIDAASAAITAGRTATVGRKVATDRLALAYSEVDAFLADELDPLVAGLRPTAPEFCARYQQARTVVDRPAGRRALPPAAPAIPTAAPVTPPATQQAA